MPNPKGPQTNFFYGLGIDVGRKKANNKWQKVEVDASDITPSPSDGKSEDVDDKGGKRKSNDEVDSKNERPTLINANGEEL